MRKWLIVAVVLAIAAGTLGAQEAPAGEKEKTLLIPAGKPVHQVAVKAYFLIGEPEVMKKHGLQFEAPWAIIPGKDFQKLIKRLRQDGPARERQWHVALKEQVLPDLAFFCPPKLTMHSGQRAYIAVSAQQNYIRDCLPSKDQTEMEPVIGTLQEGLVLDLRPVAADPVRVVYKFLSLRTSGLLGMRKCTATTGAKGKGLKMSWQEPVMLTGIVRFKNPCEIPVATDDALIIPLDFQVEQGAGAARALAADGKVKETYTPVAVRKPTSPRSKMIVCVLTAKILGPHVRERDWEIPSFSGPTFELQKGKVKPTAIKSRIRGTRPTPLKPD